MNPLTEQANKWHIELLEEHIEVLEERIEKLKQELAEAYKEGYREGFLAAREQQLNRFK